MPEQKQPNRPIHAIRYGGVKASIWCNQTRNGKMYNITVTRSYKVGEGWHESTSFGYEDLLVLAKMMDECHSWIHIRLSQESKPDSKPARPAVESRRAAGA